MNSTARERVAHIGPDPEQLGGMETVLRAYSKSHWPSFNMEVIASSVRGGALRRLRAVAAAWRAIGRSPASRFHFHLSHRGSFLREGLLILATRGAPVFATIHGSDFVRSSQDSRLWRAVYKRVLRKMTAVGVLNESARDSVRRLSASVPVMILSNPGPVDPAPASPTYTAGMSVVFAGRVGRRKGVDTLLNAWNIVSRTEPAAELTIIGPLDPDLSDAERVALAPYHVGELPPAEVQARLRTAACATLPSRAEGQPMFLIEALAFGVPIVVTDVGGMPLLAQDAGSVVKAGDHTGLARAILKILANDESIGRARLNATAKYQEQFSLAAHDRGLLTLYALRPGFRSKKKELSQ